MFLVVFVCLYVYLIMVVCLFVSPSICRKRNYIKRNERICMQCNHPLNLVDNPDYHLRMQNPDYAPDRTDLQETLTSGCQQWNLMSY